MNDIPKPNRYDVYWEKWVDAFEQEEKEQFETELGNIDIDSILAQEDILEHEQLIKSISHVRSIVTPFGILPLTEQTMASKYFKFWVGHSNFQLTKEFYKIIGHHPGIETLDILTPYRFRIAVGQLFVDREVMKSVRDAMVKYIASINISGNSTKQNVDKNENQ